MGRKTNELNEKVIQALKNLQSARKQKLDAYGLPAALLPESDPDRQQWESLMDSLSKLIDLSEQAYAKALDERKKFLETKAKTNKKLHSLKMKFKRLFS
jgi:phosphoenolpyruvate carboxylase